jgi:hypothetical protein
MKKVLLLSGIILIGLVATTHGARSKSPVQAISRMDILYLKLAKEYVGAELEIYSEEGVKLLSQKIDRRKILVDFYYETPGSYVIQLTKGDSTEKISFVKKNPCPETGDLAASITVMQGL